ncbi:hypothetical protein B6U67_03700 [Methanosarcinales archaeon ex4484_138]|nr:MAG: hypothetical protein B6U67_03700 [Methanosarcinales archaeon ex4484_138]
MIFCNKKTCVNNVNGQRCDKMNAVLFNGICRYERDRMLRWLKKQIKDTESLITDDLLFPDVLHARKKAFEEVLRWLDD